MNFGINLPGPFRVGISSKGRVSAGASVGPFSVSGQVGQPTRGGMLATVPLDELVAAFRAQGWTVTGYRAGVGATVVRGLKTASLRVTPRGVLMRQVVGTRMAAVLLGVGLLLAAACIVGPYL